MEKSNNFINGRQESILVKMKSKKQENKALHIVYKPQL